MTEGGRLVPAGPRTRSPERADGARRRPERTCVGCRGRGPRAELERVVLVRRGDEFVAVVDPGRSLPGRGAWLHHDPRCLELAERRRAFPRALRTGELDLTAVRAHLTGTTPDRPDRPTEPQTEGGLEADGHPMSTQR